MSDMDKILELERKTFKGFEGDTENGMNYKPFFSEKGAIDYFVNLCRITKKPFSNMEEMLHQNRAIYDGDSPTKDTYILLYSRPLSYHIARFFSKIMADKRNDEKLEQILADHFLGALGHEGIHQALDEFVGYCPSNRIKKTEVEVVLYKLARQGYACKLKF